jgi:acetyl-CoA synthetase
MAEKRKLFHLYKCSRSCNQFLNFLRKRDIAQHDVLFLQLPLLPANWISYLTAIKGGFRLIPSATILGVHDIEYRFKKLMPAVVITDAEEC